MKVLFILSSGHSGSTLLDLLLDGHPRLVGVGEMHSARPDELCACGREARDCPFWQVALGPEPWPRAPYRPGMSFWLGRGPYRSLHKRVIVDPDAYVSSTETAYQRILDLSGADVVVDSSKTPERVELLSRSRVIEPVVLHLVRDGRGVTWSYTRKYGWGRSVLSRWYRANLRIEVLRWRMARRLSFEFLRYEDLVEDPDRYLARLCGALDVPYEPSMLAFREGVHHQIGGNGMRLEGGDAIELDDAWKTAMPRSQRLVFDLCFGWLNAHYARRPSLPSRTRARAPAYTVRAVRAGR
jgi:hypothetical protein